jgi:two-component system sensor kinase
MYVMPKKIKILLLEDVALDSELAELELKRAGINFSLQRVDTKEKFMYELENLEPDIILADHSLPHFDGVSALELTKSHAPDTPFIFVSGKIGEDFAVEMLKKGAIDYVLKSNLSKLPYAVERALTEFREREEIKSAELALLESEEKFRTLFEKTKNPIIVFDDKWNFIDCNDAALSFMELKHSEILKLNLADLVYNKKCLDPKKTFSNSDETLELEFEIGNKQKILEITITPVKVRDTNIMFGMAQDITKQKLAEKALKEREEKYRLLVENQKDFIVNFDPDGGLIFVSPSFCEMLGKNEEEILNENFFPLVHKQDDYNSRMALKKLFKPPYAVNFEQRLMTKKGWRWIAWSDRAVLDENNQVLGFMGVGRDITERKNAERKTVKSLREKELLLREVHHRVKNNLQIISTLLSLQAAQIKEESVNELYRESQNRIRSIALIHENLYQSNEISQINFSLYTKSLVTDLFDSYGIDSDVITTHLDIDEGIMGIETALPCGLIINELVSNSLKHGFPDGQKGDIFIELKRKNNIDYVLTIYDNGIPFNEDFDYNKGDTLGLQLIKSLVRQMDADIKVDLKEKIFKITFQELKYKERI